MPGLEISAATDADLDAIRVTTLAAYAEYARILLPEDWVAYRDSILKVLLSVGDAEQLVARQNGQVVGTVMLCAPGAAFTEHVDTAEAPEVRLLAVAPPARGSGIAEALMDECVSRARAARAAAITLHTMQPMRAARRLYAQMGFVRAPELDFRPRENIFAEGYRLDLRDTG